MESADAFRNDDMVGDVIAAWFAEARSASDKRQASRPR